MTFCKAVLSLAVLLVAAVPLALAQGTYAQIDVPGATRTSVFGIDAAGDISGNYHDASNNGHGFLLSGGTYTSIDYPNALYTSAMGINDVGQIVGWANPNQFQTIGFIYDIQTQTFTAVSYPGVDYTWATAINNAGAVTGYFGDGVDGPLEGWLLVGSTYTQIIFPGAANSYPAGITRSGAVVGWELRLEKGSPNYWYFAGGYKEITIPHLPSAQVYGVNETGDVFAGGYYRGGYGGFVYLNKSKRLTTLQFPGSNNTAASGVNSAGKVVGTFVDASGNIHGFTWTPPADTGKK